jgi:hypothetical protein
VEPPVVAVVAAPEVAAIGTVLLVVVASVSAGFESFPATFTTRTPPTTIEMTIVALRTMP